MLSRVAIDFTKEVVNWVAFDIDFTAEQRHEEMN
jgi:hypothetical protein